MQQIYMQSDENFEVFTTVFSPQVCRTKTRHRHVEVDKVVAAINFRPHWEDELELRHGDIIQVLFREDPSWWFGRLQNGKEGYFPATCVTKYSQCIQTEEAAEVSPSIIRRRSMPVVTPNSPRGCKSGYTTPKLLRRESLFRSKGQAENSPGSGAAAVQPSPSLLHRVLSKSRRKSCPHIPALNGSVNRAFQQD